MSLRTPLKVGKLQRALHVKAKGSPDFRFYALYDKVYRSDVLEFAYRCCRSNQGQPGVDGQRFAEIESYGVKRWLSELAEELRNKSYHPAAVRRVLIPKQDGSRRPLGIPTIRDRVVQTAAVLVLAPIFEADFQPEQYAYRPRRSALDAVRQVHRLVNTGYSEVVEGDLSGYFDSIPQAEMMKRLKLTVNEEKTRISRVPEESFDFLGYTIGRCFSLRRGRSYIGTRPSRKGIRKLCREISEATGRRWYLLDAPGRVALLNRMLQSWANYFCLGSVSRAYRAVDAHGASGSASGCVESINNRVGVVHGSPTSICIRLWVWFGWNY